MTLFKRLPRLRWKASEAQEIIPPDVQTQCPELGADFKLLKARGEPTDTREPTHVREREARTLRELRGSGRFIRSHLLGMLEPASILQVDRHTGSALLLSNFRCINIIEGSGSFLR